MRKRSRIVLITLGLVLISLVAWRILKPREPSYNGKPFTLWLEEFYQRPPGSSAPTKEQQKAISALGRMGTNAIPIIIRTLEKNDSPMRNKYRELWPKLPAFLKMIIPKPEPEHFSADKAKQMLHRLVGTNILRHLPALLQSRNPAVREAASGNLMWFAMSPHPLSNEQLLSLCVPCLKDPDPMVRLNAAMALEWLGPAASNTVPELILVLQGSQAGRKKGETVFSRAAMANTLGSIGPAAASAIPALTNLLPSADTYLRVQIASAVWHITSNENVSLPELISVVPQLDSLDKWRAIRPLKEMGPRATPAIPMLLSELTNAQNNSDALREVTNALKAINPEAAAKAGVK